MQLSEPQKHKRDGEPVEVGFLRGIVIIVGVFLWLAVGFIGLWMLIAIFKWLWKHS
jgi:hypothetical protein